MLEQRAFSAATDALFAATSLRLPGGVLESWFFVKGGRRRSPNAWRSRPSP
ncbi:MAG TPA: hypothetical protein VFE33_25570 [Thermoanaerobaculia bacterium]|nr:hypothetical protein [Thermoanaerobaculia bacterium]